MREKYAKARLQQSVSGGMRKFGASTLSFVKLTVIFISDANLPVEDERGNLYQWDQVSEPQTNQNLPTKACHKNC